VLRRALAYFTALCRYTPEALRYWDRQAERVARTVDRFQPALCLLYHFEPIEGFLGVRHVPKVAGIGNLMHKVRRLRLRVGDKHSPPLHQLIRNLTYPLWERQYLRNAAELIASLDGAWFFADNYARYCRQALGLSRVRYFPNPAQDEREHLPAVHNGMPPPHTPYRVVLVGHLAGTATRSGLKFFTEQVVPLLERQGQIDAFEFLIVGKFQPPAWLASKLRRPQIKLLGFVDNFAQTIHDADAVLVPIPDDIGNRLRIVSAFSAEACVVTNVSSCWGMPELIDGDNCLIADDAPALVRQLQRVCTDRRLNHQLRKGGRQTYEQYFHPDVACRRIEEFFIQTVREAGRGYEDSRDGADGHPARIAGQRVDSKS